MIEKTYKPNAITEPPLITITQKPRYWELDFLRGICVILMVIDHFFYSAYDILRGYVWPWAGVDFWKGLQTFANLYWYNNFRTIMHFVGIGMFCLICGISCTLSQSNFKRGLKALAVGLLITMVTYLARIISLNITILFGVIHMLGSSMIIYGLIDLAGLGLQKLTEKISGLVIKKRTDKQINYLKAQNENPSATLDGAQNPLSVQNSIDTQNDLDQKYNLDLQADQEIIKKRAEKSQKTWQTVGKWVRWMLPGAVGLTFLIVFFAIPLGHFEKNTVSIVLGESHVKSDYISFFSNVTIDGSDSLKGFMSIFVELTDFSMGSSDYFPILPYALIVLLGSLIGRLVYHTRAKNCLSSLNGKWHTPVTFVGRHALLVYLLHQLVIVAFFFVAGGVYASIS